jgi:Zn finger protein HypA/HybF involved in hydrogenase expression
MLHKCTRCRGQVIESYGDAHCLNCGHDQLPIITTTDDLELERLLDQRATKRLDSKVMEKHNAHNDS